MLSSAACAHHTSPVGVGRILLLSALFVTRRYDVVGPEDLKGLTADDLQLLVSGKAEPVTSAQASRTSATVSSLAWNDVAHVISLCTAAGDLYIRGRAWRGAS